MDKLGLLLIALVLTTDCESVWIVPPAIGRIVDAQSGQPVFHAAVTRICSDAPAKTTTDNNGGFRFRGKRRLQVAFGDTICAPRSYQIEATDYHTINTNCPSFGWASASGLRDNLGVIQVEPK